MDADLNLMRVFEVLFEERSVTRAAARLGLTQSAVSHALGRLRRLLDDRLFVRNAHGLEPTGRAVEIAPRISEGLAQIRGVLSASQFDPASAKRRFNIAASSYFCALLVPPLIKRIREKAPGVSLRIVNTGGALVRAFDSGEIDLAFGVPQALPARMRSVQLFRDEFVWIARGDNPLAGRRPDLSDILAAPRVVISSTWNRENELPSISVEQAEHLLHQQGKMVDGHPPIAGPTLAIVHDVATAVETVQRTDAVSLVPRRYAELRAEHDSIALLLPQPNPTEVWLMMIWHARSDEDPGAGWLRDLVVAETAAADAGATGGH